MQSEVTGSDAWTGGEEYEEEYAARIDYFKNAFNETALLAHASSMRDGLKCMLHDNFSVGSFNFVKKISFEDGVQWIARLRLPQIEHFDENGYKHALHFDKKAETDKILYNMQSELAAMEFVRLNSNIPVPQVYASNLTKDNPVGFPYSLIQYVHGNTAADLAAKFPGDHEGIPEQYAEKIFKQVASIMHQLANIRVDKIGSVTRSVSSLKEFVIGPLTETKSGPYENAMDFYKSYFVELAKNLYGDDWEVETHGQVVKNFHKLVPEMISDQTSLQSFGLANYDLGPHNLIVDQEFNVIGVIDWDGVIAAPNAVLYRFPFLMGVGYATPGVVENHPACKAREQLGRRFTEIAEQTSSEMAAETRDKSEGLGKDSVVLTKTGFYSKEANAFRALTHFKMKQVWVDTEWADGLEWLLEKSEREVLDFYLHGLTR
ncbi:MAG: hypothetical protein Q9157_005251 [Trypethelium eluteriae]